MSITDELRKWVKSLYTPNSAQVKDEALRIADRIDKAHGEELVQAKAVVLLDCISVADDFIELPKDADGETIHLGDELEWPDGDRLTVNGIGEGGTLFYVDVQGDVQWTASGDKRHVQPDSWERIISDATALGAQVKRRTYQIGDFVERCKRLAGEDA